jgi:hypothetical protein
MIILVNNANRANILYWSFIKCKRVIKSVLTFELYGIVHGFNIKALIIFIIDKALRIELLLVICMDSKSLYECLIKLNIIQEKRLIIDVIYLR